MSEQEKPSDPHAPTEIHAKSAFEMGAGSPSLSDVNGWKPPEPEALDPLFPAYDIVELLGRGGMGAVYKAVQKNLKRPVAIKLLPPEMAEADPSFAERFRREAQAMAALDHPNIVTVFDFGETEEGHYYFIMEFVDGMDFHQLIHTGQLDHMGALNAVSQICDALEYAHQQGYVHRDIKPANIFINQKGVLKVGDFGLAKLTGDIEAHAGENLPNLTQTGSGIGTPDYSAPEQIEGRKVDHRADIYSLGVMLYEMLTGEIPRGNFLPPSQRVTIDVRLDEIVLKAMNSQPELRYRSITEMRTDVDRVREQGPESAESTDDSAPKPSFARKAAKRVASGCGIISTMLVLAIAGLVAWIKLVELPKERAAEAELEGLTETKMAKKAEPNDTILSELYRFRTSLPTFEQYQLSLEDEERAANQRAFLNFIDDENVALLDSLYLAGISDQRGKVETVLELPYYDETGAQQTRNVGTTFEVNAGQLNGVLPINAIIDLVGYELRGDNDFTPELGILRRTPYITTQRITPTQNTPPGVLRLVGTFKSGPPHNPTMDVVMTRFGAHERPDASEPRVFPNQAKQAIVDPFADLPTSDIKPLSPTDLAETELNFPDTFKAEVKVYRAMMADFGPLIIKNLENRSGLEDSTALSEFILNTNPKLVETCQATFNLYAETHAENISEMTYHSAIDPETGAPTVASRNIGISFKIDAEVHDSHQLKLLVIFELVWFEPREGARTDPQTGAYSQFPTFYTHRVISEVLSAPSDQLLLGTFRPGPPAQNCVDLCVLRIAPSAGGVRKQHREQTQ